MDKMDKERLKEAFFKVSKRERETRILLQEANSALKKHLLENTSIYLDGAVKKAEELADAVDELYLLLKEAGLWE